MRTSTGQSPEIVRALRHLEEQFDEAHQNMRTNLQGIHQIHEGDFFVLQKPIQCKEIPCGEEWRWNMVKSMKGIALPTRNLVVDISKLVLRQRKPGGPSAPSHKVWLFILKSPQGPEVSPLCVLWCERGVRPARREFPVRESVSTVYDQHLRQPCAVPVTEPYGFSSPNSPFFDDLSSPSPPLSLFTDTTTPFSFGPDLNLGDFDFLAPSMPLSVAQEFWPYLQG